MKRAFVVQDTMKSEIIMYLKLLNDISMLLYETTTNKIFHSCKSNESIRKGTQYTVDNVATGAAKTIITSDNGLLFTT